jgi:hypothetical protein
MKFYLYFFILLSYISCSRDNESITIEEDLKPEKIGILLPYLRYDFIMPNSDLNYYFIYDNQGRVIKRKGGQISAPTTSGALGIFSNAVITDINYLPNKIIVTKKSDDTNIYVSPDVKEYKTDNIGRVIESNKLFKSSPIFDEYYYYKYNKEGQLIEIETKFPNYPYDPNDPTDFILSYKEIFTYSNSNLVSSIKTVLKNDIPTKNSTEKIFSNYDNAKNPFKRLTIFNEYFYQGLSKNNCRKIVTKTYNEDTMLTSENISEWSYNYDKNGQVILEL